MAEVIEGYSMVFTSIVNFLFSLDFGNGTTVGGFMLAVCALSLIIRFLFRSIQAGPSTAHFVIDQTKRQSYKNEISAIRSVENRLRSDD